MKPHVSLRRSLSLSLTTLVFVCSFISCGKKKFEPLKVDPAFASYVISFTSGVVSNSSHIQVRMVQEVPGATPGKEASLNPFSIDPSIEGKAIWIDKQTIEFVPEKRMPAGEIYTVNFELGKLLVVPEQFRKLSFRFQVMEQALRFEYEGISPCRLMDKQWQQVHGIFYTADYADAKEVESMLETEGSKSSYKTFWQHSKDGKTHIFTVDSVERKSNSEKLRLKWDADKINAEKSGTAEIEIPGLNEFKVLQVKSKTSPQACIEVYFSDPISKTQDVSGLIELFPKASETVVIEGNSAKILPGSNLSGDVRLIVYSGLKNVYGDVFPANYTQSINFASLPPQVQLIGEGVIVPHSDGILFPFKAVSLSAVDVKIIKIFENNIVQFLQSNQLNGRDEVQRVGRVVYSQEVALTSDHPIDYRVWNNFSLDLSKLIEPEPGAIYRVEISFRKKHSLFPCTSVSKEDAKVEEETDPNEGYNGPGESYWEYYDEGDEEGESYNWEEKDDPCKASYYMNGRRKVARNVLASDLGIIAKAGSNSEYFITVTDLRTTEPLKDVEIEFRNYQNQPLITTKTGDNGMCSIKLPDKPFVLIAKKEKQRGYLRLDDASSLSLSMFDVKGEELKKGVKGFIYGERGVWRPGDMMYLTFVLEDKNKALPFNHPVVLELYNPTGQLAQRVVKNNHLNGFYSFPIRTASDAPTGVWSVKIQVGGSTFARNLRIETVKPNRMKINLTFPSEILHNGVTETGKLQVNWLHGAPARNSRVVIDATIAPAKTEFKAYNGYVFDDPTKPFKPEDIQVYKGFLNADGAANVQAKFNIDPTTPGMVSVQMKTMAYDAGGDFSIDRAVFKYSPYKAYVGIKMPQGKGWNGALYSDEANIIPLALVDENGKALNGKLKVEVYSVYWRWWWDLSADENLADFVSNQHTNLLSTQTISVAGGRAFYNLRLNTDDWGRKLIRVTDETSGHSSAAVFYTTYKGWWSNAGSENPGGAEMLMFQTDKKQYSVGEDVSVELPVSHEGRALISVETGSRVLQNFWVKSEGKTSRFSFKATPEMAPNAYIHVTYIQPHNHGKNDFPIRMYGVQNIAVEDPSTHLTPSISMKNTLKPLEKFNVTIKESRGKPMTYTIAIVDDGLLDLTRFKTPNPWESFYAHEALGVRTWDLYKYVSGAFTGQLAGLYAIGGDEFLNKNGKENNNRFKPVVLFQGPYSLAADETKSHSFTMPNYVGSVRVMVIAGQDGAYGSVEKTVPVKQSLMVLSTLPRVVSPSETIKVPVTVFAMDKNIKTATVHLKTDNNFEVQDGAVRTISFDKTGDKVVEFKVKVRDRIAQGKIVVVAQSGGTVTTSETNLKIRMPNAPVTRSVAAIIKPGESWTQTLGAVGIAGTNSGTLEVSRLYPINLNKRLSYLIDYPHGCIEQITSAAFPQLYLRNVVDLNPTQLQNIETNVNACLNRLKSYQVSSGGFSYWPGEGGSASEWGTSYAGHFMLEAQSVGYQLPVGLLDPWISYQTAEANNWQARGNSYCWDMIQAYRLYTLALAKHPALSAMNRMRENKNTSIEARWRLAAAYAICGKPDIAVGMINNLPNKKIQQDYTETYGSYERDMAMKLETELLLKRRNQALPLVIDVAKVLASDDWFSTQSTAYMLLAISKYVGNTTDNNKLSAELTIDGKKQVVNSARAFYQLGLDYRNSFNKMVTIRNTSKNNLYVRAMLKGIPGMKDTEARQSNLRMTVNYFDMKGKALNPLSLKQGTQFYAEVTVAHPGSRTKYDNMAISQLFPSGWEIMNSRMDQVKSARLNTDVPRYQDIRDDRVYSYFNLDKGQKKTFRILLQAAYLGSYYMPSVQCESMYDYSISACSKGQWVQVVR